MLRAFYRRSLVLGVLGVIATCAYLALVFRSFSWDQWSTLVLLAVWMLFSVMHIVRSRPTVRVTTSGLQLRGTGAWQLAWGEIQAVRLSPSALLVEPTAGAQERHSVSTAALWSRVFTPGQHPRGVIVLPRPRLDGEAWYLLQAHGLVTDEGSRPEPR